MTAASHRRSRGVEDLLDRMLDRGVLPFRPTYVRRLYKDGGRLGLARRAGGTYLPRVRLWRSERWIASTVTAANPFPIRGEGQSLVAVGRQAPTFREALALRGERILGAARFRAFGSDFPVLVKILDPAEPIVFHFHARDADVRRLRRRFPGQRFGKDEAYYFLPAPPGPAPYTHVGLLPGVSRRVLTEALAAGAGRLLALSPVIYQRPGEGFWVPAGIPHRPGTALTLEIQQPSDVYTLLEPSSGGRPLSAAEMHPGFASLSEALDLIDFAAAAHPRLLERHRLVPEPVDGGRQRGGVETWIFPPRLRKFSGKRLVVYSRYLSEEQSPYALLVWRGQGRVLDTPLRPGSEMLITAEAAARPHLYRAEAGPLEVFKFFPPSPSAFPPSGRRRSSDRGR
jgi:hypothetical protein